MQEYTTRRPWHAMLVALAFLVVTVRTLFEDVLIHGAQPTVKHFLIGICIIGVTYFGHQIGVQWRNRNRIAAAGCAVLAFLGIYMMVFMSAGRNAEVLQAKTAGAVKANRERKTLEGETEKARIARDAAEARHLDAIEAQKVAEAARADACKDGRGTKCTAAEGTARAAATRVTEAAAAEEKASKQYWLLFGRLEGMPAEVVVDGDFKAMAAILAKLPFVTASEETIEAAHILLIPLGMTTFAEIGLIVSLSIKVRVPVKQPKRPKSAGGFGLFSRKEAEQPETEPAPKDGGVPVPQQPAPAPVPTTVPEGRWSKEAAERWVVTQVALGQQLHGQDVLAEQFGVSGSTMHEWIRDWEKRGLIRKTRVGRSMALQKA